MSGKEANHMEELVGAVSFVSLSPGDVIVFTAERRLVSEEVQRLLQGAHDLWPDHRAIVLSGGITMAVVEPDDD